MKVLAGICILLSLMMVSYNNAFAQEPSPVNLTVEKNKLKIEINYPSDDPIEISLLVSLNHGLTWDVIPQKVKGDVGTVNKKDPVKSIIWDTIKEVGKINMDKVALRVSVNGTLIAEAFVKEKLESEEFEVFETPDEEPKPIGGMMAVYKHLEYPPLARQLKITGDVYTQFVVNEQGIPEQITVVRTSNGLLDQSAINTIQKAKFTPAMKDGKPIKARMTLRIMYRLE